MKRIAAILATTLAMLLPATLASASPVPQTTSTAYLCPYASSGTPCVFTASSASQFITASAGDRFTTVQYGWVTSTYPFSLASGYNGEFLGDKVVELVDTDEGSLCVWAAYSTSQPKAYPNGCDKGAYADLYVQTGTGPYEYYNAGESSYFYTKGYSNPEALDVARIAYGADVWNDCTCYSKFFNWSWYV